MKHSKLHGVAHNYAASLAGGLSFVVSHYVIQTSVFAEAAANEEGCLLADFLTGKVQGAYPEGEVEHALPLFKNAFPDFCQKHGVDISDYKAFLVRFLPVVKATATSLQLKIKTDDNRLVNIWGTQANVLRRSITLAGVAPKISMRLWTNRSSLFGLGADMRRRGTGLLGCRTWSLPPNDASQPKAHQPAGRCVPQHPTLRHPFNDRHQGFQNYDQRHLQHRSQKKSAFEIPRTFISSG